MRPDRDPYYLGVAVAVSGRADCSRRQVGAIVVQGDVITGTGYNGAPPGGPSCLAGECPRATSGVAPGSSYDTGPGSCVAVHAEANAVIRAGRERSKGGTLYCSEQPCDGCLRLVWAAGVSRIVWDGGSLDYPW